MPNWEIIALKLELSALDSLGDFVRAHALILFMGAIYLLLALLVWVLAVALRPRPGQSRPQVPRVIVIQVEAPPPIFSEPPPFEQFPPLRDTAEYDPDEHWD
jgi:hypothetical protein